MSYDYLAQVGDASTFVTCFVCLFVCRITEITGWIVVEFGGRVGKGITR